MHQLSVIGIRFGKQLERQQDNATWAELWELQWNPETEIEVVEASLMGDTVEQTALAQLREHLANSQLLSRTTELLWDAFQCGLTALVPDVIAALQRQSAGCFLRRTWEQHLEISPALCASAASGKSTPYR